MLTSHHKGRFALNLGIPRFALMWINRQRSRALALDDRGLGEGQAKRPFDVVAEIDPAQRIDAEIELRTRLQGLRSSYGESACFPMGTTVLACGPFSPSPSWTT